MSEPSWTLAVVAEVEDTEGFASAGGAAAGARGDIFADTDASMSTAVVEVSALALAPSDRSSFLDRANVWRLFWNHMVTVLMSLHNTQKITKFRKRRTAATNRHPHPASSVSSSTRRSEKRERGKNASNAHTSRSLQIASFSLRDGCVLRRKNASSVPSFALDMR